ncbi:MAG: rhodanese-like domain-containing protein [Alphaproteobacteria bacterium]
MSGDEYAGELSPKESWELLASDPKAMLVDTRTLPEWMFVGVPDLKQLSKKPIFVAWQVYPAMQQNPAFADQLRAGGAEEETPLLFICRSGNRSKAAAIAMTSLGFTRCYNVAEGFEGNIDEHGHRGAKGGWRTAGLPWVQE